MFKSFIYELQIMVPDQDGLWFSALNLRSTESSPRAYLTNRFVRSLAHDIFSTDLRRPRAGDES